MFTCDSHLLVSEVSSQLTSVWLNALALSDGAEEGRGVDLKEVRGQWGLVWQHQRACSMEQLLQRHLLKCKIKSEEVWSLKPADESMRTHPSSSH